MLRKLVSIKRNRIFEAWGLSILMDLKALTYQQCMRYAAFAQGRRRYRLMQTIHVRIRKGPRGILVLRKEPRGKWRRYSGPCCASRGFDSQTVAGLILQRIDNPLRSERHVERRSHVRSTWFGSYTRRNRQTLICIRYNKPAFLDL